MVEYDLEQLGITEGNFKSIASIIEYGISDTNMLMKSIQEYNELEPVSYKIIAGDLSASVTNFHTAVIAGAQYARGIYESVEDAEADIKKKLSEQQEKSQTTKEVPGEAIAALIEEKGFCEDEFNAQEGNLKHDAYLPAYQEEGARYELIKDLNGYGTTAWVIKKISADGTETYLSWVNDETAREMIDRGMVQSYSEKKLSEVADDVVQSVKDGFAAGKEEYSQSGDTMASVAAGITAAADSLASSDTVGAALKGAADAQNVDILIETTGDKRIYLKEKIEKVGEDCYKFTLSGEDIELKYDTDGGQNVLKIPDGSTISNDNDAGDWIIKTADDKVVFTIDKDKLTAEKLTKLLNSANFINGTR